MKESELRLGNYVQNKGRIIMVTHLASEDYWSGDDGPAEPIPLTPEWLEKCGFKYDTENDYGYILDIGRKSFCVATAQDDDLLLLYRSDIGLGYHQLMFVEHLHQLQNIIFALTGEELVIK
jgi:hypothetical protein